MINAVYGSNLEIVKSNQRFYSKKYQSDNLAKRLYTNNLQKCIDCLKPRSIKTSVSVKNMVVITFMCPIIKVFHL